MNYKKIGIFIKTLREEKKLNQEDLAELLFVHRTTVTKWESGKSLPLNDTLKLISDLFNVSIDEILAGERLDKKRNFSLELFKLNLKYKNIIVISVLLLVLSLISFLSYFFIVNYNEYCVYNVYLVSDDEFNSNLGYVTVYRNKSYLRFDNYFDSNKDYELLYNDIVIFKGNFNYTYTYFIDFKNKYLNNTFLNKYDYFKIKVDDEEYNLLFVNLSKISYIEDYEYVYSDDYNYSRFIKDDFTFNDNDEIFYKNNNNYKCYLYPLSNRFLVYENSNVIVNSIIDTREQYDFYYKKYCNN